MNDEQSFSSFFNERVKERGVSLQKLSELSGISSAHLEALRGGDFEAMPPAPYLRGYIIKLGAILDFEPEPWWSKIKAAGFLRNAGEKDAPPANRFVRPWFMKFIWAAIIALAALLYIFLQFSRIMGKPDLRVTFPSSSPTTSASNTITIRGTVTNWNELAINEEPISVNQDSTWEKVVLLEAGLNTLEIKAKKFLGGETKIMEQIIYQQPTSTVGMPS